MNSNYKPIHKEAAPQLIDQLKAGTSVFQKPLDKDNPAFIRPVNAATNETYKDINAFWLGTQGFKDPRFMTFSQATFRQIKINKGAEGVRVNYMKSSDIQAIRDPDGKKIQNEDGSTKTKKIVFEKPQMADAKVFNAEQLTGLPSLEEYLKTQPEQKLSPIERAENLLKDSGAVIEHGGEQAFYDKATDVIHLPPRESFGSEEKYIAEAIHQLAHWTGHESRLNRKMEGRFGSIEYAHEELLASIAAMMIGAELKTGSQFGQHEIYANHWANILKDNPYQITKAARDAQKSFDFVMHIGITRELKQAAAPAQTLAKGDVIAYNNTEMQVLEKKGKKFQMQDLGTGTKFIMAPADELFKKLVDAKNNPAKPELELAEGQEEGTEKSYSIKR